MKRAQHALILLIASLSFATGRAEPSPQQILAQAAARLANAKTVQYQAVRTESKGRIEQRYYRSNEDEVSRIRVESTVVALGSGTTITTRFVKNPDGIWDIWANQAVDVSTAFSEDQLLAVYPFYRFAASSQHAYELNVVEKTVKDTPCFVVKGRLANPPEGNGPDIAKEFTYSIAKDTGLIKALHEVTFANRTLDLVFERLELDSTVDPKLFELAPELARTKARTMKEYLAMRMPEVKQRFTNTGLAKQRATESTGRHYMRLGLIFCAVCPPLLGFWIWHSRTKK